MATAVKRQYSKSIGTTAVQIGSYAAPSVTTGVYVTGLVVANTTAGTVFASVAIYDGTNYAYLCQNTPVPTGASINVVNNNNRQALNAGDKVFVTSNVALSLDVNMSVAEIQ